MSTNAHIDDKSDDPPVCELARRVTILDWGFALLISALAIGGYVWLVTELWLCILFWTEWSFLIYAAVMLVLPTAGMTWQRMYIWPRRLFVLLIGVGGLGLYLAVSLFLWSQSIGLIREWREIHLPGQCSVEFPRGYENSTANHRGVYDGDLGRYRATHRQFSTSNYEIGNRQFIFRDVEILGKEPTSGEMFRWLLETMGSVRFREISRAEMKIGNLPALRIHAGKWNHGYEQILMVANRRRAYCLIVSSSDYLSNCPEVERFFDSFKIVE